MMRRPRRLRRTASIRSMVRETRVLPENLILPLFVVPDSRPRVEIRSMPGVFHNHVSDVVDECQRALSLGIESVLLFGIPSSKDAVGSSSWDPQGPVQSAIHAIRKLIPGMTVIADVCLCEYTDHGHCGVIADRGGDKDVDNDATLELLVRQSVSFANAGADFVAPSDMMDGRVAAIRRGLDAAGHSAVGIISYAAKFASGFYGPFREAAESAPTFGDRRTYQMDPANAREALREIELDISEGADMVMVKPALSYLDIIKAARDRFDVPIVAYNVSGEYAMVKAAAERGWIDGDRVRDEILTSIKRAGADLIITYFAMEFAASLAK
ncbi:MAG TPA: porphobilinogen synthase [Thermoanaerobaculia bacterium]|nr:porphobilinogen synthase [Thermoanaerobaculia bacterium]